MAKQVDPSVPDFKPPSRTPLVGAGLGGLVLGAVIAAGAMTALAPALKKPVTKPGRAVLSACPSVAPAPRASASAAPSASAAVERPAPPKGSLVARAAEGEPDAVKALQNKPPAERTTEEVVALARAGAQDKRKAIVELGRKIQLVPKLTEDPVTLKTVRQYANDGEVIPELVLMLADLPGPGGPDLMYKLGSASYPKPAAAALIEQALYAKDVRAKASAALGVLLDLRREEDCDKVSKLLLKAKTDGDKRIVPVIARLDTKTGCGPKKLDDCWACLRKTTLTKDALKEVGKRKGPP
jgi:hypothetical protein